MCGRYAVTLPPEAMASLFGSTDRPNFAANYNVAPTQIVPIVATGKAGDRRIIQARWGLRPQWMSADPKTGPLFNARCETVAEKPAFRAAFARDRCLVPADGFYEWHKKEDGTKQPYFIAPAGGAPIAFAGIWANAPALEPSLSTAILTRAACDDFNWLHHRFPIILPKNLWADWINRDMADKDAFALLQSEARKPVEMVAKKVADRVGKISQNDISLLEPIA